MINTSSQKIIQIHNFFFPLNDKNILISIYNVSKDLRDDNNFVCRTYTK